MRLPLLVNFIRTFSQQWRRGVLQACLDVGHSGLPVLSKHTHTQVIPSVCTHMCMLASGSVTWWVFRDNKSSVWAWPLTWYCNCSRVGENFPCAWQKHTNMTPHWTGDIIRSRAGKRPVRSIVQELEILAPDDQLSLQVINCYIFFW